MPRYEVRTFRDALDTEDDVEVVAATLTTQPNGHHTALVEVPDSDAEGVICGYETENGPCERETGGDLCWYHGED